MVKPLFLFVPLSEKILFVKHLSIMVKSGMTLLDSLSLIKKQARSRSLAYILDSVIVDIQNGQFLNVSLGKFPRVFDHLFVDVIKIGEETGTLSENLIYLGAELKKKQQLRSKIRAALIYPVIILVATVGVTSILVFLVLPRLIPVFVSLRVELPLSTRILIFASKFLLSYAGYILVGIIVLIFSLTLFSRLPAIKFIFHRISLSLPVIGPLFRMASVVDFTRNLALLLKSGTRIVESIIVVSDSMNNLVYRKLLREAAEVVRKGEPLNAYLEKHEKLFFPTVVRMIEVGNITGTLEQNLVYLAEFYEAEIDELTKNLTNVLEPLLLLVMGAIVGFVAIAIITPIYEVSQSFRK